MLKIKQYLNSNFCLECKECCKFEDDIWLPHLLKADEKALGIACVKARKGSDSSLICKFLEETEHKCRVYERRPFECALYPFLLVRRNGDLDLVVHLGCPYILNNVNTQEFEQYSAYLCQALLEPDNFKLYSQEQAKFHSYPDVELFMIKKNLLASR
ncbi:MAG: YkgJ family cysteine cluster protein [Candidatus Omnitrophica bacterium]|nr:YkgJ family cysteine cluster protein [Candidatus Omnitrophota bacterium]